MEELNFEQRVAEARAHVREVAAVDAVAMFRRRDDVVYLDVREQREWNLFRIPGAVHVPLAAVSDCVKDRIPCSRRVLVYCARGGRAALATSAMLGLGYLDVACVAGGVMGWVYAGGELEE
ncbi:MAG TPA: rhodanese-like domain-containing protein [Gemmatimonadaceae bacterium]|jgi:rhodanese-related sulfurtransferase|nr:rhodanese-like domain-containing protein [Gemmatimonadaceae bacterium]